MKCENCNGTGHIYSRIAKILSPDDENIQNDECAICDGTGEVVSNDDDETNEETNESSFKNA